MVTPVATCKAIGCEFSIFTQSEVEQGIKSCSVNEAGSASHVVRKFQSAQCSAQHIVRIRVISAPAQERQMRRIIVHFFHDHVRINARWFQGHS